jgi:predicted enzyme related to lactoylglutathione lyase
MSLSFDFPILYVRDVAASVAFYTPLIGAPVEASPGFAMFVMASGARLGLWKTGGVEPKPIGAPGASEIAMATSEAEVARLHQEWAARGIAIALPPTKMDFGLTFVGLDPDGHRLRVFAPAD